MAAAAICWWWRQCGSVKKKLRRRRRRQYGSGGGSAAARRRRQGQYGGNSGSAVVATAAAEWRWWRQRCGGGGGSVASSAAFPQREVRQQRGNGVSGSSPEARCHPAPPRWHEDTGGDSNGWGTDKNQQSTKIRRCRSGFGSLAVAVAAWWRWQRSDGGSGIYILDRVFINSGIVLLS